LLVVVGLITVLLGILINTASEAKGPELATRTLVAAAMAIATEYEVRTDQVIPGDTTSAGNSILNFITLANQTDITRQMLLNLSKDSISLNNANPPGVVGITDAWGRSLWYVSYNGGETNNLPRRGKSASPDPFFTSSGSDGKWGTYNVLEPLGDAIDNIHSFDLR